MGKTRLDRRFRQLCLVVFLLTSIFWLIPVYTLFNASLKSQLEISQQKYIVPFARPQLENYRAAFSRLRVGLRNSGIITLLATFIAVFIGTLGGYSLTKFGFRFALPIFFTIAVASFLPYHIVLIPLTRIVSFLGLLNTYAGLILSYVILNVPMACLISATFFMKVPPEFDEAAAIDGCRPLVYYLRILLPVSLPGLASTTILVFIQIYNEFILGIALTRGPSVKPVMAFLSELKGSEVAMWHLQMAGTVITAAIPVLVFAFLGRYFVAGLMAGYGR